MAEEIPTEPLHADGTLKATGIKLIGPVLPKPAQDLAQSPQQEM